MERRDLDLPNIQYVKFNTIKYCVADIFFKIRSKHLTWTYPKSEMSASETSYIRVYSRQGDLVLINPCMSIALFSVLIVWLTGSGFYYQRLLAIPVTLVLFHRAFSIIHRAWEDGGWKKKVSLTDWFALILE